MKNRLKIAMLSLVLTSVQIANAQSWKDLLNSDGVKDAITSVTGGERITVANITGRWNYVKPAVQLEGGSIVESAGGALASSQLESKLAETCSKIGIKPNLFSYTFYEDMRFECNFKGKTFKGTYSLDDTTNKVALKFSAIGSMKLPAMSASINIIGSSLTMLFKADKLLDFLTKISSISGNATLKTLSELSSKYDGVNLGFELSSKTQAAAATTTESKSEETPEQSKDKIDDAKDLLNKYIKF